MREIKQGAREMRTILQTISTAENSLRKAFTSKTGISLRPSKTIMTHKGGYDCYEQIFEDDDCNDVRLKILHDYMNDHIDFSVKMNCSMPRGQERYQTVGEHYAGLNSVSEHSVYMFMQDCLSSLNINRSAVSFDKSKKNKYAPKPIGYETISSTGYTMLKTKDGFKLKHRVIYENYYGVKLEPWQMITFIDGNKRNITIENLRLVSSRKTIKRINKNDR